MRTSSRYAVLVSLLLTSAAGYQALAATQGLGADEATVQSSAQGEPGIQAALPLGGERQRRDAPKADRPSG